MVGAIGWSLNRADRRLMSTEQRPFHSQNYSYYFHNTLCSLTSSQWLLYNQTQSEAKQKAKPNNCCQCTEFVIHSYEIHRLRVYNTLQAEGSWKSVSQAGCLSQCHTTLSQATECHQFPQKNQLPGHRMLTHCCTIFHLRSGLWNIDNQSLEVPKGQCRDHVVGK